MRKKLLFSSLFVILWFFILYKNLYTSFFIQTLMGLTVLLSYLTYLVYRRTKDWLLTTCFFYFTVSQLPQLIFTQKLNPTFNDQAILTFQAIIGQGLLYFIVISLFFVFFKKVASVFHILFLAAMLNSYIIIFKYFFSQPPWFLFNNPAIDASFIACMIPFALRLHYSLAIPMVMACIFTDSSSGILGPILAITFYYLKPSKLLHALLASTLILSIGILTQGYTKLINSSGRFHVWTLGLDFFKHTINPLFGAGTGTWAVYGPTLQVQEALKRGVTHVDGFFWMHNDWLQILFENGIIGLALAIIVFVRAVYKNTQNPKILSSLITFAAMASIQMPLRHIIYTVLGAGLIFYKKNK